jgi:hypothetical protein
MNIGNIYDLLQLIHKFLKERFFDILEYYFILLNKTLPNRNITTAKKSITPKSI